MATRRPQQMCILRIGYMALMMPSSKGMKVMQELQEAVEAEWHPGVRSYYVVQERPELQLTLLDPDQIVMPETLVTATVNTPRLSRD